MFAKSDPLTEHGIHSCGSLDGIRQSDWSTNLIKMHYKPNRGITDSYLSKENHGYGHLTSYDLWSRDMDFNKTSREEACCSPTKHGEIVIEHHKERQDQERDNKIKNRGDRYNRKSEVHERTVGRTCSQNEEHQVGENNIRVDTQRWKTTKRKTQKEMER